MNDKNVDTYIRTEVRDISRLLSYNIVLSILFLAPFPNFL